ncbi:MAG: hypothetical protein ABIO36_04585 [Pyrinomonadaceae bacterium]
MFRAVRDCKYGSEPPRVRGRTNVTTKYFPAVVMPPAYAGGSDPFYDRIGVNAGEVSAFG